MLSCPSSGPMVRSSRKVISRGQRTRAQQHRQFGRFLDREIAGDDARPAGDMALDHAGPKSPRHPARWQRARRYWRRYNRQTCARRRRVEAEVHRRAAVLVKRRLRIDQFLAGHHRGFFEDVDRRPASSIDGSRCCARPGIAPRHRSVRPHNRVEGQLGGGADQRLQLGRRADAGHLDQDAVGRPAAGSSVRACRPRRPGGG